ncbi:MAG TPA: hypothetical protein VGG71_00735 [Chitinophagaceae bacterium]
MKPILSASILTLFISLNVFSQHAVTKLWETDTALKVPESVLFDGENRVVIRFKY